MRTLLLLFLFLLPLMAQHTKEIVVLETDFGTIEIAFYETDAPLHTKNFIKLAKEGYFDGLQFHRVIPGFVIQGGDPNSRDNNFTDDGMGGPKYKIPAEIKRPHLRGSVGMARESDDVNPKRESSGSQFYICLSDLPRLDGKYTVFGWVIKGMDVVDKIAKVETDERDHPLKAVRIKKSYVKQLTLEE